MFAHYASQLCHSTPRPTVGAKAWHDFAPARVAIHRCITASFLPSGDPLPTTEDMMTREEEASFAAMDETVILDYEKNLAAAFGMSSITRATR